MIEAVGTEVTALIPPVLPKQEAGPTDSLPGTPFDVYLQAGGILSPEHYTVVATGANGIKKDQRPESIHMLQAGGYAKGLLLSKEELQDISASYASLREQATSIGEWPLGNSDQKVFAEALLLTGQKEAYKQFISRYPNMFETQA